MQRRQFLGAAAALAGLPVPERSAASESEGGSDDGEVVYPEENTVLNTCGGLEIYTEAGSETRVQVGQWAGTIELRLGNDLGRMRAVLLPEDADALCRELQAAKANLDPEAVEGTREWITEDYRTEDNNE